MNKIEKAFGGTQLCKSHGIVEKLCPYCEIDRLTAQLDASRALLAERDAEIARLQQQSVGWVAVFDENAALREEVERLKAVKTPPRIVHAQHCAVNSYSGRPNKCTCGLEG